MNPITELLHGRDRWTGAACVGRWDVFDPRQDDEDQEHYTARIYRAQTICGTCPILTDCQDFAGNARPRDRVGTWAGQPYDHNGRPVRLKEKP